MPFGPLLQPSIALGLLKASLTPLNMRTAVEYFTLRFAELIGSPLYTQFASGGTVCRG
jgi:hypothetical protein